MKQEQIIIILSALLLLFLLWNEIKRPNRKRLALRLILTTIAVASMALLFVPLTFTQQSTDKNAPEVLLITAGAGDVPDSFKRYKQITTNPGNASPQVELIADLSYYIAQHNSHVPSLHIMGNGIAAHEWKFLSQQQIATKYTPPAKPTGIVSADWPRAIHSGDRFSVAGTYNNQGNEKVKLVLSGVGTSLDSVNISRDSVQRFSLSCQPAHTGNTLYEISIVSGDNIISTEKIPVSVLLQEKPRILMLASAPGFENKFLATWLYENGYPVAARSMVSANKYTFQFLNMPSASITNINAGMLENFDVLIADEQALADLNSQASVAVKMQLQEGLGLIIGRDSTASLSSFSQSFAVRKQPMQKSAIRNLNWQGAAVNKNPLSAEQWFTIQHDPDGQRLVTDDQQSVIASCRLYGSGKVILNTAGTTYGWVLSGNRESYSSFWSLLIGKAARSKKQQTGWRFSPSLPTVDQQVNIVLEQYNSEPPVIKTASGDLYTTQTAYLPDTWTANWWPATTGWQTLSNTDTASIYVFEKNDWSAAKINAQINDNIMHAEQQISAQNKELPISTTTKSVPVWIFFIVFIIGCVGLWWEGKFGSNKY